jgi:hypothetical protein
MLRARRPGHPRIGARPELAGKHLGQGDTPCTSACLEETHRTHTQAGDAPGSRVPGDVVCWDRGTGQDELTRVRAIVNRSSDLVPDGRLELPLVDQSGRGAIENEGRIDRDRLPGVHVDVE